MLIPGYRIDAKIYESSRSFVYRGRRSADGVPVVLKAIKSDYPTPKQITRYRQEYKILSEINIDGVIRAYGLENYQKTPIIILEDCGGISLKSFIENNSLSILAFLNIAIQIADILGSIHAAHIIHKDINPHNLLVLPDRDRIKLIDFDISTIIPQEKTNLNHPNVLEGTLAYISPEQTGRMNRSLDYRTDFYSLGVTFYELLTHQLPFTTSDALELVHSHIAKQPVPPHEVNPQIPQAISDIVMKLLAKNAEDRYQSAWGIKADLLQCQSQLETTGIIENFPLGGSDRSEKFQIPQKLYGREPEIKRLLAAMERVSNGLCELMLISGYSGSGKSALVAEIYKPVTAHRGYFILGKFDQLHRNIPYSAIIQAFASLVQQILTESEENLNEWRQQIQAALASKGQVIIDVIPELELLIGSQTAVTELAPAEAQNRFNLVFQKFIRVFTQPSHPLVIFLDDLQWADSASLKLIQLLTTALDRQYLLLIGAYRDNEVNPAHPLMLTLDEIRALGTTIERISLSPLDEGSVNQLVCETLKCSPERARSLSELVLTKTGGNPFFMREFLKSLYGDKLLTFDAINFRWQWDTRQIQAQEFTDNVVELMAGKIKSLPAPTQEVLQLAAAIGNQFELLTLTMIQEKSIKEIVSWLQLAIAENLIIPLDDTYKAIELDVQVAIDEFPGECKFAHDRIQQAAYSLIPDAEKPAVHRQIGQLLLQNTPSERHEPKLFDIVNQLNLGKPLITRPSERFELASFNLRAGKKAKVSAAYEVALNYYQTGIELLESSSWQSQYDLTRELYVEAIEAAYLCGRFADMERLASIVLPEAKTVLDTVKVYQAQIQAYIGQNQPLNAINTALSVLNLLGIKFPEQPTQSDIARGLQEIKTALAGREIEDLIDLPLMTEPEKLAAMRLTSATVTATYFAFPAMMPLLIFKQVDLSLNYGNTALSAPAYAHLGLILNGIFLDIDSGYRFGELALNLLSRIDATEVKAQTLHIVNGFVKHGKQPVRETLKLSLDAYAIGLETGNIEYAAHGASMYSLHAYFIGKELPEFEREMAATSQVMRQLKQEADLNFNEIYRQAVLNLMGRSENPCRLVGEAYDEDAMLPLHVETNNRSTIYIIKLQKSILGYLFEDLPQAVENIAAAALYLDGVIGSLLAPLFYFYDSLIQLAIFPDTEVSEQERLLEKVRENQEKMKLLADNAPANYLHKYELVEAERSRVLDRAIAAMDYYDRAVDGAKANQYLNDEALANELAAKYYIARRKTKIAEVYLLEAHYCYQRWGATAKVNDLEKKYPRLKRDAKSRTKHSLTTSSTSDSSSGDVLDLATFMKASLAIASEIVLDKLLASLMKILIENAGAQVGFLILSGEGKLSIEAEGSVESDGVTVLQSIPIERSQSISAAIVNYVARTFESVVLNDATREGKFISDRYIQEHQPKSILCVPLINQGRLVSIVYLENNLTTGAFPPDRLEIIKLLSSQAAISIENAKLYVAVRESESRLAQFLEAIPVGIGIFDARGKPYYTNQKAQKLLGKGAVLGTNKEQLAEVYQAYVTGTNELYPIEKMPIVRALQGESTSIDDLEIHQPDKIVPIEVWGTPIFGDKGNVEYAIAAFQDITERKKAEAERLSFTQQLFELNQAYQRFVPRQFLQFLDKESIVDVRLGDQVQREMSVLFSDIRNFTALSERMTPEENFKFINAYLSQMEPAIIENQGFIDKYIGDAIMALFGGSADDAVKAGIDMLLALRDYNNTRNRPDRPPLQIGIGINTGALMLGTVGGKNRMDGTVISDAVNLASRLEGLTKHYGVSMLISNQTFLALQDATRYAIRLIDRVQVKGKSVAVFIYEVFDGDAPEIREAKLATKLAFEQAILFYYRGDLARAGQLFEECLRRNERDTVAQIYRDRCQSHS